MRKNILIFGHSYTNGFIEANNQYTKLFDKNKYDVTVVYLDGESDEAVKKRHLTENVIFLNSSRKEKRGLKTNTIKKMLQLQREKDFQIVICHRYKPTYIMLWVAKFSHIPALFSVMHEMKTLHHLSRKLLVAALASQNTIFAGVSNTVRDDLLNDILRVPPERVITLYNAIDIDLTEPELQDRAAARKYLDLSDDCFIFGILGRLVEAKNHETLINGFSLIKSKCSNAKLLIIGEGELESTLKQQVKELGLENDVILTGFLPKAFSLLKAMDVFVLSSIKEAFGRVLLEAMIAKLPIIATKTNGIPEVVGDAGILVEKKNPSQLAEKMLYMYNLPKHELTNWGERGYQRAVNFFSIQRFHEIFWQQPLMQNK